MSNPRKPLLLLQCEVLASSLPSVCSKIGETDQSFLRALGDEGSDVIVSRVCLGEIPPAPRDVAGVVITGSSAMVNDADPWIAATGGWLVQAFSAGVPLLGVCFGHQLLAHTLGGQIAAMPAGPQYASIEVRLTSHSSSDLLFSDSPPQFHAQSAHYQSVISPPLSATVLAESAFGIEALRFGPRAWGVQFHPEFRAADLGVLIEALRAPLGAAGCDVDFNLNHLAESAHAERVLTRFQEIVRDSCRSGAAYGIASNDDLTVSL